MIYSISGFGQNSLAFETCRVTHCSDQRLSKNASVINTAHHSCQVRSYPPVPLFQAGRISIKFWLQLFYIETSN